jgi:hypothetical protein
MAPGVATVLHVCFNAGATGASEIVDDVVTVRSRGGERFTIPIRATMAEPPPRSAQPSGGPRGLQTRDSGGVNFGDSTMQSMFAQGGDPAWSAAAGFDQGGFSEGDLSGCDSGIWGSGSRATTPGDYGRRPRSLGSTEGLEISLTLTDPINWHREPEGSPCGERRPKTAEPITPTKKEHQNSVWLEQHRPEASLRERPFTVDRLAGEPLAVCLRAHH